MYRFILSLVGIMLASSVSAQIVPQWTYSTSEDTYYVIAHALPGSAQLVTWNTEGCSNGSPSSLRILDGATGGVIASYNAANACYIDMNRFTISDIDGDGYDDILFSEFHLAGAQHVLVLLSWNGNADAPAIAQKSGITSLSQNAPNPFTGSTRIDFELAQASQTEMTIYDVAGRVIRTIHKGRMDAGRHSLVWDGSSDHGARMPGGAYFYSVKAAGIATSRRMIRLP